MRSIVPSKLSLGVCITENTWLLCTKLTEIFICMKDFKNFLIIIQIYFRIIRLACSLESKLGFIWEFSMRWPLEVITF